MHIFSFLFRDFSFLHALEILRILNTFAVKSFYCIIKYDRTFYCVWTRRKIFCNWIVILFDIFSVKFSPFSVFLSFLLSSLWSSVWCLSFSVLRNSKYHTLKCSYRAFDKPVWYEIIINSCQSEYYPHRILDGR